MSAPIPPAGWYDDPELVNTRRYWDGTKWTEHRQEKSSTSKSPGTPVVAKVPESDSRVGRWVVTAIGLALTVAAIWLFYGNGWDTITNRGTAIDVPAMEADIDSSLAKQDAPGFTVTCEDPGETKRGDVTYCHGKDKQGTPITVKVTFEDDGDYSWETI